MPSTVTQPSKRFAIRTIRDGRVTIAGKTYEVDPQHMPYDGRLDDTRCAFGRYSSDFKAVCLWGTEEMYWAVNDDERFERLWSTSPHCIDGSFPWQWWREVAA